MALPLSGLAASLELCLQTVYPFLDPGDFTKQQVTTIRMDLIERTTEFQTIEHLCPDALPEQQIEGFVGKKLQL